MSVLDTIDLASESSVSIQGSSVWEIAAKMGVLTITSLPNNWDTYGSPPPTDIAVDVSLDIIDKISIQNLPVPHVVPVPGGGIQFEWTVPPRELELEILPNGSIEFLKSENGEPHQEGEIPFDPTKFRALLGWLISKQPR